MGYFCSYSALNHVCSCESQANWLTHSEVSSPELTTSHWKNIFAAIKFLSLITFKLFCPKLHKKIADLK